MSICTQHYAATHRAAFQHTRPWSDAEFTRLQQDPTVQFFGTEVCFLIARFVGDEAEVLTLATHPDHQRQGQARIVLGDFMRALPQNRVRTAFLEVAKDNAVALGLYRSFGFETVGLRKNYYLNTDGTKSDACVLQWQVSPEN